MSPAATNGAHQARVDDDDAGKAPPAADFDALDLDPNISLATHALHADTSLNLQTDVAPSIHVATTFRYDKDPNNLRPFQTRSPAGLSPNEYCYSRYSAPNSTRLETILSVLLKNPCLTYSSGLSALHALFTFLNPKKVAIGDGYHGSHGVLDLHIRLTGCTKLPLDCKPEDLNEGDLICLETPVNPTGKAFNIAHYAAIAHSRGAYLCVDSTFAPPPLQDPFKHGADIVMHSGTKYIGGHSDLLCGVLAVKNKSWIPGMFKDRSCLGSVMGSLEGWLGVRSLRTLELRVTRQSENAGRLVDALDGALTGHTVGTGLSLSDVEAITSVVASVTHASLQADDMSWLRKQMPQGYGPVFSITMKSAELAKRLPSKLKYFDHATSLGGVESLIEWRTMTDPSVEETVLRVSVGVEDARDLLDDLVGACGALVEEGVK